MTPALLRELRDLLASAHDARVTWPDDGTQDTLHVVPVSRGDVARLLVALDAAIRDVPAGPKAVQSHGLRETTGPAIGGDLRYFAMYGDGGEDWFATEDEARAAAAAALDDIEVDEDGWPDDTERITWGVELGGAVVVERGTFEEGSNHRHDEWVQYGIRRYGPEVRRIAVEVVEAGTVDTRLDDGRGRREPAPDGRAPGPAADGGDPGPEPR